MDEEIRPSDLLAAATQRLERALERLSGGVRDLERNAAGVAQLKKDRRVLVADRDRLNTDLTRSVRRADALDKSAAEVSRRLVDAMEAVRTVLAK